MSAEGGVGAPAVRAAGACTALYTALQHLADPEGDKHLYHAAAGGLHLASRELQAAARDTLRHLRLDRYYKSQVAASGAPGDLFSALPWAMLAACPAVTSWTLHGEQLQWFQPEVVQMVGGLAPQLKCLEVRDSTYAVTDTQLQGMGRLMWGCSQLEEVRYWDWGSDRIKPWLLLDPTSTSITTAVPPPLPIRRLVLSERSGELLSHWVQQQRLGRTLQQLTTVGSISISDLAPLTNLRDLRLTPHLTPHQQPSSTCLKSLSCMTKLTRLRLCEGRLRCRGAPAPGVVVAAAASFLTGLQSLSLPRTDDFVLPSRLSSLKRLTSLKISGARTDLPAALGDWLPRLERMDAIRCSVTAVPSSLTCLSWLSVAECSSSQLVVPTSQKSLRHLDISQAQCTSIIGLSSMSALEALDASSLRHTHSVLGEHLAVLQPLTRLKRLDLSDNRGCELSGCTVLETLQRLTFLGLRCCDFDAPPVLPAVVLSRPLPALQELQIRGSTADRLKALAPWLAQLTALTSLDLAVSELADGDELLYLPPQLKDLCLSYMRGLQQVPCRLMQLTALEFLDMSCCSDLCQLPAWLSQLRRLRTLWLHDTGVIAEQQVLAQMPGLRRMRVNDGVPVAVVCGSATPPLLWEQQPFWLEEGV